MEDCCAVCAEPLEWVGYGLCGHRDVCSTCIARLRFVLCDKQCCICKQECPSVFVTKALGDYTKSVDNFEALAERRDLWYESNIQAYFDDEEQFKMMKAMCRLSCSVCERAESAGKEFVKKGHVFRNLDLLRRHLFNAHKVQMCGLCLEGRKVFICEQKLYSKKQLERHLLSGDSEIDGNDEDRGGFTGHPLCNFCRTRFYGDNELYQHMSTDHYTCHICQRLHPGRYDYYRNYDDLEAHFRHEHALCEHPDCLAQKFVVFSSDAELKRHNALVHGGNMSRAQRNAALQIPVSFQYRRPGQDRRGDRPFRRREANSSGPSLGGSQASIGSFNVVEQSIDESSLQVNNTDDFPHFQNTEMTLPMPSSASRTVGTETASNITTEPSRYLVAVSGAGPSSLKESAFPPLPGSENAQQKAKQHMRGSPLSMASLLGGREGRRPSSRSNQDQMPDLVGELPRNITSQPPASNQWPQVSARQRRHSDSEALRQSSSVGSARAEPPSDDMLGSVSGARSGPIPFSVEELRIANKALIESIRSDLQGDEERFNDFKIISAQYRSGEMDAKVYLHHIKDFGLLHIVPELARLCPDPKRKEDLLDMFQRNLNNQVNGLTESLSTSIGNVTAGGSRQEEGANETKMKSTLGGMSSLRLIDRAGGLLEDNEVEVLSKDGYRDSKGKKSISNARNKSIHLSKPAKVLVKAIKKPSESPSSFLHEPILSFRMEGTWTCNVCTLEMKEGSTHCAACGTAFSSNTKLEGSEVQGNEKKKKKKAVKLSLGDGSVALLQDSKRKAWGSDGEGNSGNDALTGNGAWGKGGGQRLVSLSQGQKDKESTPGNNR